MFWPPNWTIQITAVKKQNQKYLLTLLEWESSSSLMNREGGEKVGGLLLTRMGSSPSDLYLSSSIDLYLKMKSSSWSPSY